MRTIYGLGMLASLLLVTGEARPCGGGFGTSLTIKPAQKIVVSYHGGVETYVFNPEFCGQADTFGLILPIPGTLSANPDLAKTALYNDLISLSAPTIVTTQECDRGAGGSRSNSGTGGAASNGPPGTVVIQRGQVGIFDWVLLQAKTVSSFTDWLTANGFPYQTTTTSTFQYYVDSGWYFIAFKVSAAAPSTGTGGASGRGGSGSTLTGVAGGGNTTICGSFGPISLSFPIVPQPVIPARIAAVSSSSLQWDIFSIASEQQSLHGTYTDLRFSGAISSTDLESHPSLASLAQPGDRLTEMMLNSLPNYDLVLEPSPSPADYRRTETRIEYINCSGGATSITTSSIGGANRGGAGSGGKATGGSPATGGEAVAGGAPASGGQSPSSDGGVSNGGARQAGGSGALGGLLGSGGDKSSTNGDSGNLGTSHGGAATVDNGHDDGAGCSIVSHAVGKVPRGMGIVTLLGALALLGRRRRGRWRS
jgi:hypothetical protein